MSKRSYFKEKDIEMQIESLFNFVARCKTEASSHEYEVFKKRKIAGLLLLLLLPLALVIGVGCVHNDKNIAMQDFQIMQTSPAVTSGGTDVISIPAGTVKANPFLPYRELTTSSNVVDVPQYELLEPPEMINESSDAARVLDTIVSGILYDKYSPSAILNIEGNDYLVKKGDIVNNYKVISIQQDSVTVKLGNNTYKAGIGEILTEGSINYNEVSNLKNKFGGEKR